MNVSGNSPQIYPESPSTNSPTPISLHFNQPGHSINKVHLNPLELIRSKRDSVAKALEEEHTRTTMDTNRELTLAAGEPLKKAPSHWVTGQY